MRGLESLEHRLKPFGKSISLSPFVVAVVCALIFKLGSAVIRAGFPLGFLLVLVGTLILANYFFEIVEHRAVGNKGWPVLSFETLFTAHRQVGLKFAVVVAVLLGLRYALSAVGFGGLTQLYGVLVAFVLPVSAAMLAVTKSLVRALDPAKLLESAVRMEIGYIAILVASFVVWVLATRAAASGAIVLLLLTSYGYLLLGFIIGAVVYARRAALGVRTRRAPEDMAAAELEALTHERQRALDHAYGLAGRDNVSGALAYIAEYARSDSDPLGAEIWLFQEMTLWKDPRAALELGRELPDRLAAAGREREARKVIAMRDFLAARAGAQR